MKITSGQIHSEENRGTITLQTQGTTRVTVAGDGTTTFAGTTVHTGTSTFSGGAFTIGAAADTVAFFGATAVAVQATTATTGTFAAGVGTAALSGSSWVGNVGSKAYTNGDVVSALKAYNLLTP